jgi:hypothetical protein
VTAGWTVVVQVTVAVAVVELGLLGLIRQVCVFFFHSCVMDCSHYLVIGIRF